MYVPFKDSGSLLSRYVILTSVFGDVPVPPSPSIIFNSSSSLDIV